MLTRLPVSLGRFGRVPMPLLLPPVLLGLVVAVNALPGSGPGLAAVASCLGFCAVGWGRLLGRAAGVQLPTELAVLLGFALTAHILILPDLLGGGDLFWSLMALPLGLLGLSGPTAEDERTVPYLLALVAAFGFAALWSLAASVRYAAFLDGGALRIWLDVFVHAGVIAHLGDPRAIGQGDIALAGAPFVLYHMGSHALAAVPVRLGLSAPLDVVTTFWLPLGAGMTALGFLALGRALAGLSGGTLALLALALLPDPSAYWLRQGFLSFHWMLETAPGTLFALPVAMASVGLVARWHAGEGSGMLLLSLVAMAGCILLRAHIFVWLLPPLIATIWLLLPWLTLRRRVVALGLVLPFGIATLLWLARSELAQAGPIVFLTRFIVFLHGVNAPTGYDGLYPRLTEALTPLGALPLGLGLALLGMAGVWLLLLPLGAVLAVARGRFITLDVLPFLLIGWAVLLMILAPTPYHGDFTDFRQRGFVLVVAVMICWCASFAVRISPIAAWPLATGAGAVAALGLAALWLPEAALPRMSWGADFVGRRVPPALLAAAREIRASARSGESFALLGTPADASLYDEATIVLSVSGVPAYLSRVEMMRLSGAPRAPIAEHRLALLAAVAGETDADAAMTKLREEHVTFLIAGPGQTPAWDMEGHRAIWQEGGYRLWRVSPG